MAATPTKSNTSSEISYVTVKLSDLVDGDGLAVKIQFANTTGTMYLSWVKLEIGSVATPLSPRSFAEELATCQRYYVNRKSDYFWGVSRATNSMQAGIEFPVPMRAVPTISAYNYSTGVLNSVKDDNTSENVSIDGAWGYTENGFAQFLNNSGKFVVGHYYVFGYVADAEIY